MYNVNVFLKKGIGMLKHFILILRAAFVAFVLSFLNQKIGFMSFFLIASILSYLIYFTFKDVNLFKLEVK